MKKSHKLSSCVQRAGLGMVIGTVAAAGAMLAKQPGRVANLKRSINGTDNVWHAVTVDKPREEVVGDGTPPAPLAAHRNALGFRVRSTPDGRRTEIRARLREGATLETPSGVSPNQVIQEALEDTKKLLEGDSAPQPAPSSASQ